jgi:7-cyano-7-deazaguanine synthase
MGKPGVLLASGGLDSTTLAYWLVRQGRPFDPLFVHYGQHCATTELDTLRRVLPRPTSDALQILNVSDVYRGARSRLISEPDLWQDNVGGDDLYLPYRNLLLLSVGAAFAQARGRETVYAAFINSNHAKEIDCSAAFFDSLAKVLADYGGVSVDLPFRTMAKGDVVRLALQHDVPIGLTYSCQAASAVPCGACSNCVDRLEALRQNGLL